MLSVQAQLASLRGTHSDGALSPFAFASKTLPVAQCLLSSVSAHLGWDAQVNLLMDS